MDWYERNPARIPVMLPGWKLTMNASPRQTAAFPAFEAALLQMVAAKLGLSYERLKGDWIKIYHARRGGSEAHLDRPRPPAPPRPLRKSLRRSPSPPPFSPKLSIPVRLSSPNRSPSFPARTSSSGPARRSSWVWCWSRRGVVAKETAVVSSAARKAGDGTLMMDAPPIAGAGFVSTTFSGPITYLLDTNETNFAVDDRVFVQVLRHVRVDDQWPPLNLSATTCTEIAAGIALYPIVTPALSQSNRIAAIGRNTERAPPTSPGPMPPRNPSRLKASGHDWHRRI
jgi:hypothetical protein